jgi:hypothetical protein
MKKSSDTIGNRIRDLTDVAVEINSFGLAVTVKHLDMQKIRAVGLFFAKETTLPV